MSQKDRPNRKPDAPPRRREKLPLSAQALAHELQVHRTELEMQNEELRRTQLDLASTRDRFVALYDFAPVGYFTLDAQGRVVETNLTGATLLGEERRALLQRPFSHYIAAHDADRWHECLQQAWQSGAAQRVDLAMHTSRGAGFQGQLDCLRVDADPQAAASLRVTLSDVSQRQRAEMYRRFAAAAHAGREADRRRLSLELHEDLGQRLSALKMDLHSLHKSEDSAVRRERMAAMLADLDVALATVRRTSADLRPTMLDDLGLGAALEWLVQDTATRLGVRVSLQHEDTEPLLDEGAALAAYRLVQELLNGLAADQRRGDVQVGLKRQAAGLALSLQRLARIPSEAGPALPISASLQERVDALGGQLAQEPGAPGGPRLTVRVPLVPEQGGGSRWGLLETLP